MLRSGGGSTHPIFGVRILPSSFNAISVTIRVPSDFADAERKSLERAAAACPIKHSFRSDIAISTQFEFSGV